MRTAWVPWLLMSILLLPAAGAVPVEGTVEASGVQGQGTVWLDGSLRALLQPYPNSQDDTMLIRQQLSADHIRIESVYTDPTVIFPNGARFNPEPPRTEDFTYNGALVGGTDVRSGYRFDIFPVHEDDPPRVQVNATCGGFTPGPEEDIRRTAIVRTGQDDDRVVPTQTAMQWSGCSPDATAVITGDFHIRLWEVDIQVTQDNETTRHWSGRGRSDTPVPVGEGTVTRDQELRVTVTAGVLSLSLDTLPVGLLVDSGAVLAVQGTSLLRDAEGSLHLDGSPVEALGQTLTLQGRTGLEGSRGGDRLDVAVSGSLDEMAVAGNTVAVPTGSWLWSGVLLASAAVALAIAGGRWHVMHHPEKCLHRAAQHSSKGRHHMALRWCQRARRLVPHDARAAVLHAATLTRLGRFKEALDVQGEAQPDMRRIDPELAARNAFEAARTCHHLCDDLNAVGWLHEATTLDPLLVEEVWADPLLSRLWRKGSVTAYS